MGFFLYNNFLNKIPPTLKVLDPETKLKKYLGEEFFESTFVSDLTVNEDLDNTISRL